MSPDQKLFVRDQLQELLKRKIDLNLDNLFTDIEACLSGLQQGQQFDDITMLALKRNM